MLALDSVQVRWKWPTSRKCAESFTLSRPTALSTYKLNQLGVTHVVNVAQAPTISMYPPSDTLKHSKWQDWGAVGGFVRTSEVTFLKNNWFQIGIIWNWTFHVLLTGLLQTRWNGISGNSGLRYDHFQLVQVFLRSRLFHWRSSRIRRYVLWLIIWKKQTKMNAKIIRLNFGSSLGTVLVHCHAGISRSATIVAAFLMIKRGMTAQEAIRIIRLESYAYYIIFLFKMGCSFRRIVSCSRESVRLGGKKNIIYFFFFRFAEGLDLKIEMEHR